VADPDKPRPGTRGPSPIIVRFLRFVAMMPFVRVFRSSRIPSTLTTKLATCSPVRSVERVAFKSWPCLAEEIAHAVRSADTIGDRR
jgi:hypothetical protein